MPTTTTIAEKNSHSFMTCSYSNNTHPNVSIVLRMLLIAQLVLNVMVNSLMKMLTLQANADRYSFYII